MNTAGFYKIDDNELLFSTNVSGPDFDLSIPGKDEHAYPVDGWHWFDTIEDARAFFKVAEPSNRAARRPSRA